MNTSSRSFIIKASHLGPIFSLEGHLSCQDQNLIFARNGTGKSFLARAFRYLDLHGQGKDVTEAAFALVSDEAEDNKGFFSFSRGSNALATLKLEKPDKEVAPNTSNTIFHVFSKDFVQEELEEEHEFKIKDNIVNRITIGSENIKIRDKQKEFNAAETEYIKTHEALQRQLEGEKESRLIKQTRIHKNLMEYKKINLADLLEKFPSKPKMLERNSVKILEDLENLKTIPAEPIDPKSVNTIEIGDIDLEAIEKCLQKVTSPSSISGELKKKIDDHHDFYEIGTQMFQKEHRNECPFCEQEIKDPNSKEIIEAYISYFADKEESHKKELRKFYQALKQKKIA